MTMQRTEMPKMSKRRRDELAALGIDNPMSTFRPTAAKTADASAPTQPKQRTAIRQLRSDEPLPTGAPRRYKSSHGYIRLRWLVRPNEYVEIYEHRVNAGRPSSDMHVHHINGIKDDNRPENLVVVTPEEHRRLHGMTDVPIAVHRMRALAQREDLGEVRSRVQVAAEKRERQIAKVQQRAAEVARMRELYEAGLGLVDVGVAVGIHHTNVFRRMRAAGVEIRPMGHRTSFDVTAAVDMYRSGHGIHRIGAHFSVAASRILTAVDAAGVARHRCGRQPGAKPTEHRGREVVYDRSGGICERCATARGQEWHHRKNRSQGGTWEPSNGLHLCSPCHRFVTENPTAARAGGWLLTRDQIPSESKVKHAAHGWVLLDNMGGYDRIAGVAA